MIRFFQFIAASQLAVLAKDVYYGGAREERVSRTIEMMNMINHR